MKASELRIGNWVLTCTPGQRESIMIPQLQAQVQGVTLFNEIIFCHTPTHEGFSMPSVHVMGIPLTEEWLLKFGFHRQTSDHFYVFHNDKVLFHIYNGSLVIEGGFMPLELKYFHQVQNIYFSLTGNELAS